MRNESVTTNYTVLSKSELDDAQLKVMNMAQKAVLSAYSPYSEYQVGAAILMEDGQIVIGNNQENAVYPLGLCAERVALFNLGTNFPNGIPTMMALAIASEKKPGFPCGSCRQAMVEFEQRFQCKIAILIESKNDEFLLFNSIKELLPFAFDQDNIS